MPAFDEAQSRSRLPQSLEDTKVTNLPPAAYYIADFINPEEEKILLEKITSAAKPRWKQLVHRRLQSWPSDLVNNRLIDSPLPSWLVDPIITRLKDIPQSSEPGSLHIFGDSPHQAPNHVLINEYPPGIGIMPHKLSLACKDGPAYHPVVCTVSLGASLCLGIYKSKDDGALEPTPVWRILQEPRSLLITTGDLYTEYLHGIDDISEDEDLTESSIANWTLLGSPADFGSGRNVRGTRTSLTYRDVMSVSKLGIQKPSILNNTCAVYAETMCQVHVLDILFESAREQPFVTGEPMQTWYYVRPFGEGQIDCLTNCF